MSYVFAVAVGFALAMWAFQVFQGGSKKLDTIIRQGETMAGELDALKAEVAETKGVMRSAKVLIDGFSAKLQAAIDAAVAAGGKPEEFIALREELDAESTALAESVAANP